MVKFTVLKFNKFLLSHLGIFSKQSSNQTYSNAFFKALNSYYILLTTTAFVVASVIFVLKNSSQFDIALRTCAIAIGTFQSIGMYFCFGLNMKKVHALHFKLQKIIDESVEGKHFLLKIRTMNIKHHCSLSSLFCCCCSDDESTDHNATNVSKKANSMYWTSESKYREFSKKMFYYGCFQISTFVTPLLQPIVEICIGNVDITAWSLPFNVVVPFDMRESILGWLLTWFFQVNVSFAYGLCMIIMTTDFVGSCYYTISICNHFELLINSMHLNTEQQIWPNVKAKLQRAIEQHIKLYEYISIIHLNIRI